MTSPARPRALVRAAAALACATLLGLGAAPMAAHASEPPTAAEWLDLAASQAAEGRFDEAAGSYRRALRAANQAGDSQRASEAYARMLEAEIRAKEEAERLAEEKRRRAEEERQREEEERRRLAHVTVVGAPRDAALAIDDGELLPVGARYDLSPGPVELTLALPSKRLRHLTLDLATGEELTLDLADLEGWTSEPPPQPVAFAARPLTLPGGTLSIAAGVFFAKAADYPPEDAAAPPEKSGQDAPDRLSVFGSTFDLGAGLLDDLELELAVAFGRFFLPTEPIIGLRGRLLAGDFELALSGHARAVGAMGSFPGGYLGLSFLARAGEHVRVDGGVTVSALHQGAVSSAHRIVSVSRDAVVGLSRPAARANGAFLAAEPGVPLSITFSIVEQFHLGVGSGFGILDFAVPSSIFVPLEAHLGGTILVDEVPTCDLQLVGGFPYLFAPVVSSPLWMNDRADRTVLPEWWQLALSARGFIYL